jgi:carbamoylphosphate synthase large subunit
MRRHHTPPKTALVLGDYRQSIIAVRSLARAGYRVTLGTTDPASAAGRSRHVSACWLYTHESDESFLFQLESYLTAWQPDLVFVVGETQLRSVARAGDRFGALARWAAPAWDTIMTCFDKHAMNRLALDLGIPTPDWQLLSDNLDVRAQSASMGYPMVIKPRDSSFTIRGKKAVILSTESCLNAFLASAVTPNCASSLMLQKFASGSRHNCHFGAVDGNLVFYFQQKVLRTDELDDTGIGVEGVSVAPCPVLKQYCALLVKALGYNGIGCIQFLVDEAAGQVAFLELNARMDSTAALPYHLGYDFPRLAAEIASNGDAVAARSQPSAYPAGARYHWLFGDILSWLGAWRSGKQGPVALFAWLMRSALTTATSHHLTWDFADPAPTLHQYAGLIRRFVLKRLPSSAPSSHGAQKG